MSETPETGKIRLVRHSSERWRVTFDLPPLNIFGPAHIPQLEQVVSSIESDDRVKVVVFDSAVEGFFLTHYDFLARPEESAKYPVGRTGLQPLPDMLARLSRAPVVSISLIRGRATGVGSELALATDMRFASREKAVLSQFEIGGGFTPGGGPMVRLPRMIGRGRALEILLSGNDYTADIAERYGYVNRAVPDAELDGFVDTLARRIASFDKHSLADIKQMVNASTLPANEEVAAEWSSFITSVQRPAAQRAVTELMKLGLQQNPDVETNLPKYTGQVNLPH
jgi:enoyl-CoA hydratase/carnithine racemase